MTVRRFLLLLALTVALLLSACIGGKDDVVTVTNDTPYTFCKVEQTPNLSIYAPWQVKTRVILLRPGKSLSLSGGDEEHILHLETCDGHYGVSNYGHWPEPGEPWVITEDSLWDRTKEYVSTPHPTRIPAVVTLQNETGKAICSLQLSPPEWMGYQFGENILDAPLQPGETLTLREPEQIKYATYAIGVTPCDGDQYVTDPVTFQYKTTIILRGAPLDTQENLKFEHEE